MHHHAWQKQEFEGCMPDGHHTKLQVCFYHLMLSLQAVLTQGFEDLWAPLKLDLGSEDGYILLTVFPSYF